MRIVQGDLLKHRLNDHVYEAVSVDDGIFILKRDGSPYRLWLGKLELELFFDIITFRTGD